MLGALRRVLPVTEQLHGQRFFLHNGARVLLTPLMLALIVVETTDVIFAVYSIPAILAITTDTFVVYTSNVFALLGMRALYYLLAGAAARFRYLQPGRPVGPRQPPARGTPARSARAGRGDAARWRDFMRTELPGRDPEAGTTFQGTACCTRCWSPPAPSRA